MAPLDLQAEAADALHPQGEVQLEGLSGAPFALPLVPGEARYSAALQLLEDAPFGLPELVFDSVLVK